MTQRFDRFIVTCEHGGNRVPRTYRSLFAGSSNALASHRGYDPGALVMARRLAATLDAPLVSATITRLLVELNRSQWSKNLFSRFSQSLSEAAKEAVLENYYRPYRQAIEKQIATWISQGHRVLHLSSHSFTPILDGTERRADIGLLFDPRRAIERLFCEHWQYELRTLARSQSLTLAVRRNYPYLGRADGFTSYLRKRFADRHYAGIELEVNQKYPLGAPGTWRALQAIICESLATTLNLEPSFRPKFRPPKPRGRAR